MAGVGARTGTARERTELYSRVGTACDQLAGRHAGLHTGRLHRLRHPLARLGRPLARRLQRKFARGAKRAMILAVATQ
jgi:hypothetical protein